MKPHSRSETLELQNGAAITQIPDGVNLRTASAQWSYSLLLPVRKELLMLNAPPAEVIGAVFEADVEVAEGAVGFGWIAEDGQHYLSDELSIHPREARHVRIATQSIDAPIKLCIRNVRPGGMASEALITNISVRPLIAVDIERGDNLLELAKSPEDAPQLIADRIGSPGIAASQIGALRYSGSVNLDPDKLWTSDIETLAAQTIADLSVLVDDYDIGEFSSDMGILDADYPVRYLRQTIIRVCKAAELLREMGLASGTLLEIGTLFGPFALAMQRLGYQVTAVDRYDSYGPRLQRCVRLLEASGVRIVSTTPETEIEQFEELGDFDAVLSMAVVEHIPHTPRLFLDMLVRRAKPGGVVMLDTPNHVRYWSRMAMAAGRSVFQSLPAQYFSDPPFIGHHREYTPDEMAWMMAQAGLNDVRLKLFDYNIFQFDELSGEHVDALMAMCVDPALADTILVAGRKT